MNCAMCGENKVVKGFVLCKKCKRKDLENLTKEQYIQQLEKFRKYIEDGGELWFYDDETPGCKDTEASWGLCCKTKSMWEDAEMHLWPHAFRTEGRVAPKWRDPGHHCPMDKRAGTPNASTIGCVFECRIFQGPKPSQKEALKLYDIQLDRIKGNDLHNN